MTTNGRQTDIQQTNVVHSFQGWHHQETKIGIRSCKSKSALSLGEQDGPASPPITQPEANKHEHLLADRTSVLMQTC